MFGMNALLTAAILLLLSFNEYGLELISIYGCLCVVDLGTLSLWPLLLSLTDISGSLLFF